MTPHRTGSHMQPWVQYYMRGGSGEILTVRGHGIGTGERITRDTGRAKEKSQERSCTGRIIVIGL